jgi:hypothetical protein
VSVLDRFVRQKTVLLITYRRDGSPVPTPVNIVVSGTHAYFRTYDKAWKSRRLANHPEVEVAPSTFRGRPTGPPVHGRTRLLHADETLPVRRLLRRKYPLLQGVAVPLLHRIRGYRTLHYELTLEG